MTDILSEPIPTHGGSCTVCKTTESIYTCPRCALRTCSLACSTAHKARDSCSGIRDKTKYVAMNKYGWGTMMDDYVFLEDVGRQVDTWGRHIAVGHLDTGSNRGHPARGRGRGARLGARRQEGNTKRDILRMQLDHEDIEMDLLPAGMERRKLNQSTWDAKNKTAFLTIEFVFHPPPDFLASSSSNLNPAFTLLTHRNNIDTTLLSLIQRHITTEQSKSKKDDKIPAWIRTLVNPDPADPQSFTCPECYMKANLDPLSGVKSAYHKFDPTEKLSSVLQHTHFAEFPTIELWKNGSFRGVIVDAHGTVTRNIEDERNPKRRKVDVRARKETMTSLLGRYGSDDEDDAQVTYSGLSLLGDYPGSDQESTGTHRDENEDAEGEVDEGDDDDDASIDVKVDPATLLQLMKQAGALDADADEVVWSNGAGGGPQ